RPPAMPCPSPTDRSQRLHQEMPRPNPVSSIFLLGGRFSEESAPSRNLIAPSGIIHRPHGESTEIQPRDSHPPAHRIIMPPCRRFFLPERGRSVVLVTS